MKRLIFAGTPAFAAVALERLLAAGFEVALVLTQPDRPAGRGMKLQASAVKQLALSRGLPLAQPRSLRLDGVWAADAAEARHRIEQARADAMIVAAYGLILPPWVLALPSHGCLNIHASLLPRWRGAAPIQRAIEAGDTHTGITIMQMDAGLDTGDMLLAEPLRIEPDDTTASLHDRLAALGGRLVVEALELSACGGLHPTAQPAAGVTYAQKIGKAEAQIDWRQPAGLIERRVRAFNPAPGASTALAGEPIKVWAARISPCPTAAYAGAPEGADGDDGHASAASVGATGVRTSGAGAPGAGGTGAAGSAPPGQILSVGDAGIAVQTGDGVLTLTELQRAGGKRLPAREWLRGFPLAAGQRLDAAPDAA